MGFLSWIHPICRCRSPRRQQPRAPVKLREVPKGKPTHRGFTLWSHLDLDPSSALEGPAHWRAQGRGRGHSVRRLGRRQGLWPRRHVTLPRTSVDKSPKVLQSRWPFWLLRSQTARPWSRGFRPAMAATPAQLACCAASCSPPRALPQGPPPPPPRLKAPECPSG